MWKSQHRVSRVPMEVPRKAGHIQKKNTENSTSSRQITSNGWSLKGTAPFDCQQHPGPCDSRLISG